MPLQGATIRVQKNSSRMGQAVIQITLCDSFEVVVSADTTGFGKAALFLSCV